MLPSGGNDGRIVSCANAAQQFGQGGFTYTYSSTSRGGQEQMSGMMEELFKMGMMANMMFENMDPSMLSPFASEHMCRELRNRRDYYKVALHIAMWCEIV